MKTHLLALATFLVAGSALASNVNTFPIDPYNSKGQFENIRYMAVDPATTAQTLKPVSPAGDGSEARLSIMNPHASYVNLYVNATYIGDVESLDTAVLNGLKPGVYEVEMVLPNGFSLAWRWSTDPKVAPEPMVPPVRKPRAYTCTSKDAKKKGTAVGYADCDFKLAVPPPEKRF